MATWLLGAKVASRIVVDGARGRQKAGATGFRAGRRPQKNQVLSHVFERVGVSWWAAAGKTLEDELEKVQEEGAGEGRVANSGLR